jgi:hypothetical protein
VTGETLVAVGEGGGNQAELIRKLRDVDDLYNKGVISDEISNKAEARNPPGVHLTR